MAEDISNFSPSGGRLLREDSGRVNTADLADEAAGGKGFAVVADTSVHTPAAGRYFRSLYFLSTTVIASLGTADDAPITGSVAGISFAAGTWLYGKFTNITLTSGSALAYNGVAL
jgi:hypothetical protein